MGEYPLRYSEAIDVSSMELYRDVPGDVLYHPFVLAERVGAAAAHRRPTRLQRDDIDLPLKKTEGTVEVAVPRLEMHAMVVLE